MPQVGPFEIDQKTYFTVQHAAEIIGPVISNGTLHRWATLGHTPGDLDLDIKREPVLKRPQNCAKCWAGFGTHEKWTGFVNKT